MREKMRSNSNEVNEFYDIMNLYATRTGIFLMFEVILSVSTDIIQTFTIFYLSYT